MISNLIQLRGWSRLLAALAVTAATAAEATAATSEVARLVARSGLHPVEPPQPATDFELPRIAGGFGTLAEYRGQWVVLTFWASWCGPCRVEMPSLEKLHRLRGSAGLAVLGVSIDTDREAAATFIEQHQLTFPMLWDELGRAATDYRASAIPLSYVVDPAGFIVAAASGARDWTDLAGMVDGLLAAVPPGPGEPTVWAAADSKLQQLVLDPPAAELVLSNAAPVVGERFTLDIHLRWTGRLDEYLPQPPQVSLPAGFIQEGVTASTDSRQGSQVVLYRVALRSEEPGSFALDPIELRYLPRDASGPAVRRVAGPTVEIQPRRVAGLEPLTLALATGGLLLLSVVGLAAGRRWRRAAALAAAEDPAPYERLHARLDEARASRLRGDNRSYVLALLELDRELRGAGSEGLGALAGVEEMVRYGGQVPPDETVEHLRRGVEKRLAALKPDPVESARRGLKLRDRTH